MKRIILSVFILLLTMAGCRNPDRTAATETVKTAGPSTQTQAVTEASAHKGDEIMKISIKSVDYEIIYELNQSDAAKALYAQLPLTTEVEPFSNNEMTFYPPEKLDTANTPLSGGAAGALAYYKPWGDVVMFYGPCDPNGSLYELGTVISGENDIESLSGTITISAYEE